MTFQYISCSYKGMSKLPYTVEVKVRSFSPENLDVLAGSPFCFFLDSAGGRGGRYSYFGTDPVRTFSSTGGTVTIDGHTFIDNPTRALGRFETAASRLPHDPYLPFSGGLVGFVGHSWPRDPASVPDTCALPDAWFGLYDTILTFDHLEGACWISSMGVGENGEASYDLAKQKCERFSSLFQKDTKARGRGYIIKPLIPEPISNFGKDRYISAIEVARGQLNKKEWQRANLARRFHAPVAVGAWSIHKLLRQKNPTPYASFMRCGNFELLSTSPSCFLQIEGSKLICNVVQKSIARTADPIKDKLNTTELLHSSVDYDPVVLGDENSLENVLTKRPELAPAHLESDNRSHYLINQIEGKKISGCTATDCLASAMPGASMTGVPKAPVNSWLKVTEPARRHVYTGAMGYIGTGGSAQFNMAVRTMIVKDQVAFVHAGWQIDNQTDAEEAYYNSKTNINRLFEEIKGLGF